MKRTQLFALLLFSSLAWAAGTFTLEGELKAFTPEKIEVSDGHKVFVINRKKISVDPKTLKIGQKMHLQVPFEAVESAGNNK